MCGESTLGLINNRYLKRPRKVSEALQTSGSSITIPALNLHDKVYGTTQMGSGGDKW